MEFKVRILNTVKERDLFKDGDHLVLGLSGGPDSLSLYNALLELMEDNIRTRGRFGFSFTLHPVHVNHKFRPGAAEEDQAFCEKLTKTWNEKLADAYPVRSFVVDCNAMAKELGMTSEEAGRKARYDAFRTVGKEVMDSFGCEAGKVKILVAQNADDQAETILFRILRGTGPDDTKKGRANALPFFHAREQGKSETLPAVATENDQNRHRNVLSGTSHRSPAQAVDKVSTA